MKAWLNSSINQRTGIVFLLIIFLIGLLDRWYILTDFHFQITDVDQLILWQGARDYAHGIFHQFYFYGQRYGPMVESVLAVPLLKLGMHEKQALPVVTAILSFIPFILFCWYFARQKLWLSAALVLAWPALLYIDYGIIINQSRGFVAGIAIASLSAFCLQKPTSTGSIILISVIAPIALWACPNSALLFAFVVPILWFDNLKNWQFYVFPAITFSLVYLLYYKSQLVFVEHPELVTHGTWNDFRLIWVWAAFRDMEFPDMLNHLLPFANNLGWAVLPILLILSVAILRVDKSKGAAMALFLAACILAFGHSRIYNGSQDLFLSLSRNWLALPVAMSIGFAYLVKNIHAKNWMMLLLLIVSGATVSYKITATNKYENYVKRNIEFTSVAYNTTSAINDHCAFLDSTCKANSVDLVLFVFGKGEFEPVPQFYNYGCASFLNHTFPSILEKNDRLSWNEIKYGNSTHARILLHGGWQGMKPPANVEFDILQDRDPQLILVKSYSGTAYELLTQMDLNKEPKRRALIMDMRNENNGAQK